MKLEYKDIINKHKNSPALVIGHGVSLNPYIPMIKDYKDKGYILFGCNFWEAIYKQAPDYWVLASNFNTIQKFLPKMNACAGNTSVLYADSVDLVDRSWVQTNLKADYLGYDQKHFDGLPCYDKICCKQAIPGRLTVQQEVQQYTEYNARYGSGDTVVLHSIAFSILFGCNPIYILGMDLDYKKGGYANNLVAQIDNVNELSNYSSRHVSNCEILRNSAEKIGVDIYSGCENTELINTVFKVKKPN